VVADGAPTDGFVLQFDIRPWLWSVARRYNAEGVLKTVDASALFCLVHYSADSSSTYFTVHPWVIHYLCQVLENEAQGKEDRNGHDDGGKEEEADEAENPSHEEAGRKRIKRQLRALGGLMAFLHEADGRLLFALQPKLLVYDCDLREQSLKLSALFGLVSYSVAPWGEGHYGVLRKKARLAPFFFRQTAICPDSTRVRASIFPRDVLFIVPPAGTSSA